MNIRRIYQVLIVDDEEYILQSVSALLESDRRFELELFRAQSVNAAISIMQRRRIDILITDIQMPSCSGIHLAHVVRERWPDCKTLVFTAHADFQLARDTIHEGVMGYILKADSDDVLIREFHRAVEAVDADLSHIEQLSALPPRPDVDVSYLIRRAWMDLLEGRYLDDDVTFKKVLQSMGGFSADAPLILVCALTNGNSKPESSNWARLECLTERYLSPLTVVRLHENVENRPLWLLQLRESGLMDGMKDALTVVAESYATCGEGVAVLVSSEISDARGFHDAWKSMCAYQIELRQEAFVHVLTPQMTQSISYSQRVLTRVMQYVENNIAGDLSLATLSRIACYNASYLSRLFMEKKGVTLSNYIAQRRMEYIQLWLADETITLNEIAARTGFESRSYFNRFVKRMTGISPMQLRKNILMQKSDTP